MELIKIDTDHFVVVNKTIQPVNGYYYDSFINKIKSTNGAEYGEASHCWQITHSTQPIEEGTTIHLFEHKRWNHVKFIDLSEVKELLGEVDKFELFLDREIKLGLSPKDIVERIKWYYQTYFKEDNKENKYTEEDLKYMFECGRNYQNNAEITFKVSMEYLLQTKTSWQVEIVDGKLKLKGI